MKVKGRADSPELALVQEALQQEAIKAHLRSKGLGQGQNVDTGTRANTDRSQDRVNVEVAKLINDQLNPEAMAAARRARVAELTQLVRSGQYKSDSEAVARALIDEIASEILLSGPLPPIAEDE